MAHKAVAHNDQGFTLLEIVLSLAILAGALAALGEVMRLADRNAAMVRDESQAQILASTVMDELLAGSRPMAAANQEPFEFNTNPRWLFSIALDSAPQQGLLLARVSVEQELPVELEPAQFELVRWLINADDLPAESSDESTDSSSSSSSGSSSSGSSSSFGDTGGAAQP